LNRAFDKVKIPFYQQMKLLLKIQNVKIYIKISYIRSYMFRSIRTILRELCSVQLHAAQHTVHTAQLETHAATTLHYL